LYRDTVLTALVVLTGTSPKPTDEGDSAVGSEPVAFSGTRLGLFEALVSIVRFPAGTAPRAVGVRVMPIVQLAPAASEPGLGQVVDGSRA